MKFKDYINEVSKQAAIEKAEFRLVSFMKKAKDEAHLSKMINLRTKKTKDINKLIAWAVALEDENLHDETKIAVKRLKELGYKGRIEI